MFVQIKGPPVRGCRQLFTWSWESWQCERDRLFLYVTREEFHHIRFFMCLRIQKVGQQLLKNI